MITIEISTQSKMLFHVEEMHACKFTCTVNRDSGNILGELFLYLSHFIHNFTIIRIL
jgi:hypothetical protein